MTKKKLLEESTIRRWGKLADIPVLSEVAVEESEELEEGDTLEEDNFDKSGPGPEREGAGKDGEHKGIAKNQGDDAPDSPEGKLEVPGTSYQGDHKMKDTSVTKKSIEGGTPLVENEDMMDDEEGEEMPADDLAADEPMDELPGEEMPAEEPMDMADAGMGGNEELLKKVIDAVAGALGVEVSIDGEEAGEEMSDLEEPMGEPAELPGEEMPAEEPALEPEEEDDLSAIATESLVAELEKRGAATLEEEEELEESEDKEDMMKEAVEQISKRVAERLLKKKVPVRRKTK